MDNLLSTGLPCQFISISMPQYIILTKQAQKPGAHGQVQKTISQPNQSNFVGTSVIIIYQINTFKFHENEKLFLSCEKNRNTEKVEVFYY